MLQKVMNRIEQIERQLNESIETTSGIEIFLDISREGLEESFLLDNSDSPLTQLTPDISEITTIEDNDSGTRLLPRPTPRPTRQSLVATRVTDSGTTGPREELSLRIDTPTGFDSGFEQERELTDTDTNEDDEEEIEASFTPEEPEETESTVPSDSEVKLERMLEDLEALVNKELRNSLRIIELLLQQNNISSAWTNQAGYYETISSSVPSLPNIPITRPESSLLSPRTAPINSYYSGHLGGGNIEEENTSTPPRISTPRQSLHRLPSLGTYTANGSNRRRSGHSQGRVAHATSYIELFETKRTSSRKVRTGRGKDILKI
jgi:hypothetical protein